MKLVAIVLTTLIILTPIISQAESHNRIIHFYNEDKTGIASFYVAMPQYSHNQASQSCPNGLYNQLTFVAPGSHLSYEYLSKNNPNNETPQAVCLTWGVVLGANAIYDYEIPNNVNHVYLRCSKRGNFTCHIYCGLKPCKVYVPQ